MASVFYDYSLSFLLKDKWAVLYNTNTSTFVKIDTSTHSLTAQALSEHTDLEDVVLKAIPLTGGVSSEV